MILGPLENVGIVGGGTAWPALRVTNAEALRAVAPWALGDRALDDARIDFMARGVEETLGVRERAWAHVPGTTLDHGSEETTVTLGARAAEAALRDARVDASAVPLVVCATATPPRMTSTISAPIGAAIGARAACIDVRSGCSGGLVALVTAALHVAAGVPRALVIGAETFSKVIPRASKIAAISLGDGAAALLLERRDGSAVLSATMASDGDLGGLITTDGALPPTHAEIDRGAYELTGTPDGLATIVPEKYDVAIGGALSRAGLGSRELTLFVPHQTSLPLIRAVASRAGIDEARTYVNVHRHANVGAAGVLGALVEARADGRLRPGGRALLAVVGGGMSWAAAVLAS